MKLIPAFDAKKAPREVELFLSVTGREHWEKLIQKTDTSNGLYKEHFLLKRNPLLSPLKRYIQLSREGKSLWQHRTEELDFFIGTVSMINRILKGVNERGQNRIKGRLRSDDIRPLLHEIDLTSHFFRNGFDVNFVEYERKDDGQRTYDFLVTKGSVQAEIECKWKSIDLGEISNMIISACFVTKYSTK